MRLKKGILLIKIAAFLVNLIVSLSTSLKKIKSIPKNKMKNIINLLALNHRLRRPIFHSRQNVLIFLFILNDLIF